MLYERTNNYEKAINLFEDFYDKLQSKNKIEALVFLYGFYIKHKKYYQNFCQLSIILHTKLHF